MVEIREGMVTCGDCALGAQHRLDAETAAAVNTHAVDMLSGEGNQPDSRVDTRILRCAAAIAVGVCRTYAASSQTLVNRASLPTYENLELPKDNPYL